ncbi:MAG: class I SAM-dependent methyltransferase [bacterium]
MNKLIKLFDIYRDQGLVKAFWVFLRVAILPAIKINKIIPKSGTILDIGCGNGGLTNYLSIGYPKRKLIGIDLSKDRITDALETTARGRNVSFINADVTKAKLPKVDVYMIIDVLHHISYSKQEKLIAFLSKRLSSTSILLIKEVDNSNKLPFLFGHIIEKILYPQEKIYTRSKSEWKSIFNRLGLKYKIESGIWYFNDSTTIYILKKE